MFESYLKPPISFPTLTGSIVTFNSQYAGLPLKSHKIALTATQSGSGTPSPDNVRTINGYSAIGVSAMGKNLFDKDTVTLGKWITNTGTELNATNGAYSSYIPIITNIPYYFSHIVGIGAFYSIVVYDEDKIFIETVNIQGGYDSSGTITFTQGSYIRVNVNKTYLDIVQVELGSIATAYEPYNGTYTTIQIGSTVYGGEYDARTGVLTVTHKGIIYDGSNDENWRTYSGQRYTVPVSDFTSPSNSQLANIVCDKLETITKAQQGSRTFVISGGDANSHDFMVNVGANSYNDMIDWLNANPITVAYELATPITIQLPSCPIDTLEVNNIWADTGDTTLQYIKFG